MAGKKKITVVSNEENAFSKTANKIMNFVKGISKPEDTEMMAENADFTDMKKNETVLDKIEDCIGFPFYHVAFGTVTLKEIRRDDEFPIILDDGNNVTIKLNKDGKLSEKGEVLLYPCEENRDWNNWSTFVRTDYEDKKNPQPFFHKGEYIVSNGKKCIFDKFVDQDQHLMIDTFVAITDHDDITNEQVFIRAEGGSQLVNPTDARLANSDEIDSINKHLDTLGLMFDHDNNEISEKKWSPKKNEKYYYINYDQFEFKAVESVWTDSFQDKSRKKVNNVFKYKKSAQEWVDKYNKAFESINAEMRNRKD